MRPIIKQDIAIYAPEVRLGMEQGKEICTVLISNSATIRSLALKAIYFSFENITDFDEGAAILVAKALLAMQNKAGILVAFIGYSETQFPKLKALFPNRSLPLFRTEAMASFLFGLRMPPLNQEVIYFDTDGMAQTLVSKEIEIKGYDVTCVATMADFLQKRKALGDKAFYINDICFDTAGNFIPTTINHGIVTYSLYKKVDKSLSVLFNVQAHASRLREGYKVFIFDASDTKDFNAAALDFLVSLALNNTRFDAQMAICGLQSVVDKDKMDLCSRVNIRFFESIESALADPKIKEASQNYKQKEQARRGLTKQLVAQLPVFINAAIETLSQLTGGTACKTDYKVTPYNKTGRADIMGAMITFEGDVAGVVTLSFAKDIVQEASMMLLGEECQSDSELIDVISEFTNIIAGRSKAVLGENNISIGISLPKPCKNEDEIAKELEGKQGVQVNLLLNDKPLVLFLAH